MNTSGTETTSARNLQKIRVTVLCARSLAKRDLFRLPDPFVKICVETGNKGNQKLTSTNQIHATEVVKNTLDPKWNQHYDVLVGAYDAITISVWNDKKVNKESNVHGSKFSYGKESSSNRFIQINGGSSKLQPTSSAFLGCIRLLSNAINRLKDTGYQRLDLVQDTNSSLPVKGQIVISLLSRDGHGTGSLNAVVDNHGNLSTTSPLSPNASSLDFNDQLLPPGWEERRTANGRIYYVNHHKRTTQWNKPRPTPENQPVIVANNNFGGLLPPVSAPAGLSRPPPPPPLPPPLPERKASRTANESESPAAESRVPGTQPDLVSSVGTPPLPHGYEAKITQQGQLYFLHVPTGAGTWHDPRVPKDLLAVLMSDSANPLMGANRSHDDILGPFPSGWEKRDTTSRRPYYVDHNSRTTQFTDPRLTGPFLRTLLDRYSNIKKSSSTSATPNVNDGAGAASGGGDAGSNVTESNCQTGDAQQQAVVADDAGDATADQVNGDSNSVSNVRATTANNSRVLPPGSSNVAVATSGNNADRADGLSNSNAQDGPEHQPLITSANGNSGSANVKKITAVEPLPKYKRDLVMKIKVLRNELSPHQPQSGHCRLEISRTDVFEDSYRLIVKMRPKDLKKRLMIKFKDEDGLDYGGVAREWLYLLSHEMLNPYYGLFQYSRDDMYTLQINPDSGVNPDHLSYFHFVGRIMGMAVFHGHHIDGGFTTPFYKMLLSKHITLDDIESVDFTLHKSLKWMLDNNIDGEDGDSKIDTTFSVEHEAFGVIHAHDLKEGGKDIPVTEANKKDYVKLYVNYRWCQGIEQQFLALHKGFHEVVPQHHLKPFDERELELLIGGIGKIDIEDWKANTRLKHCATETPVVQWFWLIVESYAEEMRARLLQFVTGSSRVPLAGFKALQGSTGAAGPRLFTLHVIEAPTINLPKAHTCFNRLDLPPYETREKMTEKLTQAVEETCGFAVE